MSKVPTPQHILIIGAGVFGLSTTLSLLSNPTYKSTRITILDAAPTLPNPSGSSVDANRIVRADYALKQYSQLAIEAQELWRDTSKDGWGGEGRYHEPGFLLSADGDAARYLKAAMANVQSLALESDPKGRMDRNKIVELNSKAALRKASGYDGVSGDYGYVNFNSGWADAEACVAYGLKRIQEEGGDRVTIRSGILVDRLLYSGRDCTGVEISGGKQVKADLTILAAGAWSPSLIDLQGRCLATGQALAFIDITEGEQKDMENRPTIMNMSRGMFIIPPRGGKLKIARHGFGYRNLVSVPKSKLQPDYQGQDQVDISIPKVGVPIPPEGMDACRAALQELVPSMGERPFVQSRICWYCDTPTGDFLITHHPHHKSLFLATGGSGHGFKFFPVIGGKIVAAMEGKLEPELRDLWRWRTSEELAEKTGGGDFVACEDGSRAGRRGMILDEEMKKTTTEHTDAVRSKL